MTNAIRQSTPVVLCIMDGWGLRDEAANNAVALAHTPCYDSLLANWPHAKLAASGADVGLPDGQVGNSEVGHMNIGAGRIVKQDLPRLNEAAVNGSLASHPELRALAIRMQTTGGRIHVMGLVSKGGVHSHQDHMIQVISGLCDHGAEVLVHGFTDGRDVLPTSARHSLPEFLKQLPAKAQMVTLTGRYFAMDRDQRWERTAAAFNAIQNATSQNEPATDVLNALETAYRSGETDEFITPRIITGYDGMGDGDAVVMVNFRADRVRQILSGWLMAEEAGLDVSPVSLESVIGMTSYSAALDEHMITLFGPQTLTDTLGEVVAAAGKTQLRLAETEKYPHVTFFLNGGQEAERDGETRELVPSPKVATYDLQPEMSAAEVLQIALGSISAGQHDLIVINFANPDMVGHTGSLSAAIAAVETIDGCVGALAEAVLEAGGQMLVTADHGNCEMMWDEAAQSPHTAHTTSLVPVIHVGAPAGQTLSDGRLADLAPSLLAMLNLGKPAAMTGSALQIQAGA